MCHLLCGKSCKVVVTVHVLTCSVAARCPGGAGPVQSEGCGPGCSERKADSAAPTPTVCWPEDLPLDASHPAPAFHERRGKSHYNVLWKPLETTTILENMVPQNSNSSV